MASLRYRQHQKNCSSSCIVCTITQVIYPLSNIQRYQPSEVSPNHVSLEKVLANANYHILPKKVATYQPIDSEPMSEGIAHECDQWLALSPFQCGLSIETVRRYINTVYLLYLDPGVKRHHIDAGQGMYHVIRCSTVVVNAMIQIKIITCPRTVNWINVLIY